MPYTYMYTYTERSTCACILLIITCIYAGGPTFVITADNDLQELNISWCNDTLLLTRGLFTISVSKYEMYMPVFLRYYRHWPHLVYSTQKVPTILNHQSGSTYIHVCVCVCVHVCVYKSSSLIVSHRVKIGYISGYDKLYTITNI